MDEPLFKITESKTAGAIRWSKRALQAEARAAKLQELVEEWQAAAGIGVDSDGITPAMAEAHWGKLADAQTPRSMNESPKDGTWIKVVGRVRFQDAAWRGAKQYQNYIDSDFIGWVPDREESKPEAENQPEREDVSDV